jgi:hypothetical protein
MKGRDLAQIRSPKPTWKAGNRCAVCHGSPTCPQIADDLWQRISPANEIRAEFCAHCDHHTDHHYPTPTNTYVRCCNDCTCPRFEVQHDMLCFECAEKRLGRLFTLDDLQPCVGNYAPYVMQQRAAK